MQTDATRMCALLVGLPDVSVFAAEQQIPLYVPLLFLAWGVLIAWTNRRAFRDVDAELHRIAAWRANSKLLRFFGESNVPQQVYERLQRGRGLIPVIAVAYTAAVLWMLVVAIRQL